MTLPLRSLALKYLLLFFAAALAAACSFTDDPCNGEDWTRSKTPVTEDGRKAWNDGVCSSTEKDLCQRVLPSGYSLLLCSHDPGSFTDDAGVSVFALHCQYRSTAKDCKNNKPTKVPELPIPPPGH